ncbi:hypothetical protein BUALT_Bualt03G0201700 [Buddleja alternifolia]|uniref:ATP-dependent DNA helicase n=1 Tax=Buddleja alternifolia TaxID=168488 RepID=A0AAV6Y3E1_9LAMI|nr:hypothetical protein BUALT_Bualt03G0201700 [Buddleja alternifolia]
MSQLLGRASSIVWDEAPMADKKTIEIVDRTLREMLEIDLPFGGKVLHLEENIRAQNDRNFSELFLRIGNGEEPVVQDDMARIPDFMAIPWAEITYYSFDSVPEDMNNLYFPELLNSLTSCNLPPHKLVLKKGASIMLLRNIGPKIGLCNGTRLICRRFGRNLIDAEVLCGQFKGTRVFLPGIPLKTSEDAKMPFEMICKQFPETSIGDLSQDLLIHIFSFLQTINAIRASLPFSHQWRNLWHHIPTLNFDMSLYHSPPNHLHKSRQLFAEFIIQTLIRRPHSTPFHSFHLLFSYRYYCRTQIQVDSWTRRAIASGAAVLRLSFTEDLFIKNEADSGIDDSESYEKDLLSLVEACLVFDRAEEDSNGGCDILLLISGVERLTLRNMRVNRELWPQVFDRKDTSECSVFKNLKYLELQTGYIENDLIGIAAFLELCPELETLVVDYNYESDVSIMH